MKKKIFILPILLMITIFSFLLSSCSSKEELNVVSFEAMGTQYSIGDTIDFTLKLENPNNYLIESAVINDKSYTVSSSGVSSEIYSITSSDLVYTSETNRFVLTQILYQVNGEIKTLNTNKTVRITEKVTLGEDVKVKSVKLSSLTNTNSEFIYQNDKVNANIVLEKANNVLVLFFYFQIVDEAGNKENVKKAFNDDGKSDVYDVNFVMPSMEGNTTVTVTDIDYVKGTAKKTVDLNFVSTCKVMIQPLSLIKVNVSNSRGFKTDVNDQQYLDATSNVDIEIVLENHSNIDVIGITVCGKMFNLLASDIKKSSLLERITIQKTLNLSDIKVFPTKLTLDGISYKNGSKVLKMNAELTKDIYFYDKIITSTGDLKSMKVTDGVITGRYILGKDLIIDDVDSVFFKNYTFAGTLEGNGHSIIMGSTGRSLFKSISKNALIQNVSLSIGVTNSPVLCDDNAGDIKNVVFGGSVECQKSKEVNVICNSNSGSITNIHVISNLIGNSSSFALLKDNTGRLANVVVDPQSFTLGSNVLSPLPDTNYGRVENIVLLLNNWYRDVDTSSVKIQNSLILIKKGNGTYTNIILNKAFRDRADQLNKLIDGPNAQNPFFLFEMSDMLIDASISVLKSLIYKNEKRNFFYDITMNSEEEGKQFHSIVAREGFTNVYYSQLGFRTYNDSNNCFWKLTGTNVSINWQSK